MFDPDHHGLAGFSNSDILDGGVAPTDPDVLAAMGIAEVTVPGIVTVLRKHQPNVVLLMSGSNGFDDAARNKLISVILVRKDWLAFTPAVSAEARNRLQAQADLDFLRQERIGDWTQNDDLWAAGILSLVPEMHSRLTLPIEKRLFILNERMTGAPGLNPGSFSTVCYQKAAAGEKCSLLWSSWHLPISAIDSGFGKP